jgi:hypothetical protein
MAYRIAIIPNVVRVAYSAMYLTINPSASHIPKPQKGEDTRTVILVKEENINRRGEIGFLSIKDYENFAAEVMMPTLKNPLQ